MYLPPDEPWQGALRALTGDLRLNPPREREAARAHAMAALCACAVRLQECFGGDVRPLEFGAGGGVLLVAGNAASTTPPWAATRPTDTRADAWRAALAAFVTRASRPPRGISFVPSSRCTARSRPCGPGHRSPILGRAPRSRSTTPDIGGRAGADDAPGRAGHTCPADGRTPGAGARSA